MSEEKKVVPKEGEKRLKPKYVNDKKIVNNKRK